MKRVLASIVLCAGLAAAAPASAGDPAPTHRKHYYTPQYRSAPARREPAHQRSHLRSTGPVRKVWRKREWWQYHDQDEIVVEEDDGIVIEEDDGIVVDEDE